MSNGMPPEVERKIDRLLEQTNGSSIFWQVFTASAFANLLVGAVFRLAG